MNLHYFKMLDFRCNLIYYLIFIYYLIQIDTKQIKIKVGKILNLYYLFKNIKKVI